MLIYWMNTKIQWRKTEKIS